MRLLKGSGSSLGVFFVLSITASTGPVGRYLTAKYSLWRKSILFQRSYRAKKKLDILMFFRFLSYLL